MYDRSKEQSLVIGKLEVLSKRREAYLEFKSSIILELDCQRLVPFGHSSGQFCTTILAIVLVGRVIVVALGTLHG